MQNVLILVALATVAFVFAHKLSERLQRWFLVATGVEYIVIGLVLGPEMPWDGVLQRDTLDQFAPIISLSIGWIGLTYGMQANIRDLVQAEDGALRLALTECLVTMGIMGLLAYPLLTSPIAWAEGFQISTKDAQLGALILAASAAVGSPTAVAFVRRRYGAKGPITTLLARTTQLGELFTIVAFGVIFCLFHKSVETMPAQWNAANWVLVTVGLGVGLGLMFRLFLGDEHNADKQFLSLLGIVVFAAGAAYLLQLSLLLINLMLGVTLANTCSYSAEIKDTLLRYQRPMFILILIFAGALWTPVSQTGWILAVVYLALRSGGRFIGGWATSTTVDTTVRRDIGQGLLGHGEVAVAMAISARLVYEGPVMDLVFNAVLCSVVINEIWAARMVRGLLINAGEINADAHHSPPPQPAEMKA